MFERMSPVLRLGIASLALIAAVAVYVLARSQPPAFLQPFHLVPASPSSGLAWLSDSAPSLFYVLSIGIFLGSCASTAASARRHCLIWIGIALALEVAQADPAAAKLTTWLAPRLPDPAWYMVGPYLERGVFDPLDLFATLVGGSLALAVLSWTSAARRSSR